MAEQVVPTKGNLLTTKKYLDLSELGFDLLDRKRNILVRELMSRIDEAREIRRQVGETFEKAYRALQQANITMGMIGPLAERMPVLAGLSISSHSVMGVELPQVQLEETAFEPAYSLQDTNSQLDYAYTCFFEVRALSAHLAEVENGIYRLTNAIKKTQRRANALKNIIIPRFSANMKFISDALEEKEREEFSRMKVLKKEKE